MTTDDLIKSEAALFAWRKAGDVSANAMLGILFVLRNRVAADGFPNSWLEVLDDAESREPGEPSDHRRPDPREPQFAQTMEFVDSIYDNSRADNLTGGALYWGRLNGSRPSIPAEVRNNPEAHPRTGVVGLTTFFK